jgi:hypothetical protein
MSALTADQVQAKIARAELDLSRADSENDRGLCGLILHDWRRRAAELAGDPAASERMRLAWKGCAP